VISRWVPEFAAALDCLRPGDTLSVWKLDRLGRSVRTCSRSPTISTPASPAPWPLLIDEINATPPSLPGD
jgi:hypothetical protein